MRVSTKVAWLDEALPPALTATPTLACVSPIGGAGAATVSSVAEAASTRAACPPKVTTLPREGGVEAASLDDDLLLPRLPGRARPP